jgi:uncharacterized protein DUF4124
MMPNRVFRIVLPTVLASMLGVPLAHADIYTWTDASGVTNVSNLPPPQGVQVTKILHGPAPEIVAREDAARDAARAADAQALAARVRQLEDEISARQAPPPMAYPPLPPPPMMQPVIQYIVESPTSQVAYIAPATPGYSGSGCDPSWAGCALSWFPGFYPASVLVVPGFRPSHPIRPHNPVHQPGHPFGPPMAPNFTAQLPTLPFGSTPGLKRG